VGKTTILLRGGQFVAYSAARVSNSTVKNTVFESGPGYITRITAVRVVISVFGQNWRFFKQVVVARPLVKESRGPLQLYLYLKELLFVKFRTKCVLFKV
jgi:hypothetical protein